MTHPDDGQPRGLPQPWLRLREDEIEYADGSPGIYTVVEKDDFVVVIPFQDGGFWLVEQFRYTVGSREWEFPQGGWPDGRTGPQEELAVAELAEETGLRAASHDAPRPAFAAYGFSSQSYDVFLAADLTAGEVAREHTEADMVHRWFAEDEVRVMLRRGEFRDAHSVAALALLDLHRSVRASPPGSAPSRRFGYRWRPVVTFTGRPLSARIRYGPVVLHACDATMGTVTTPRWSVEYAASRHRYGSPLRRKHFRPSDRTRAVACAVPDRIVPT